MNVKIEGEWAAVSKDIQIMAKKEFPTSKYRAMLASRIVENSGVPDKKIALQWYIRCAIDSGRKDIKEIYDGFDNCYGHLFSAKGMQLIGHMQMDIEDMI